MGKNHHTVRTDAETYNTLLQAQEASAVGTPSLASLVMHAVAQVYGGETTENGNSDQ